jgi:hypothetical protein
MAVAVKEEVPMKCDFEKLLLCLNKELDVDKQLEVIEHIDNCLVCREALFMMARDRDADLFIQHKLKEKLAC